MKDNVVVDKRFHVGGRNDEMIVWCWFGLTVVDWGVGVGVGVCGRRRRCRVAPPWLYRSSTMESLPSIRMGQGREGCTVVGYGDYGQRGKWRRGARGGKISCPPPSNPPTPRPPSPSHNPNSYHCLAGWPVCGSVPSGRRKSITCGSGW